MNSIDSFADRLTEELREIINDLCGMIGTLDVKQRERYHGGFVLIAPEYYLAFSSESQSADQVRTKSRYLTWYDQISLLVDSLPEKEKRELESAHVQILNWIDFDSNIIWGIDRNANKNAETCLNAFMPLSRALSYFQKNVKSAVIVIPDTNSLLKEHNVKKYENIVGTDKFTFLLLPSVLSELDKLKITHRSTSVQNKAKKIVNMIKGYRKQGHLLKGVTVHKSIQIKMVAKEPDFTKLYGWLDQSNMDDRLIASTLEAIREYPTGNVVLVTGDINLQNKAEIAGIAYSEPP